MTNDKGCRRRKGAQAGKLAMEPDESVKGCVRYCMSILWVDKGSDPESNVGARQQQTRMHLAEGT